MLPIPHEKEKSTARLQALMELFYFHTDLQTYKVPTPGEMVVGQQRPAFHKETGQQPGNPPIPNKVLVEEKCPD